MEKVVHDVIIFLLGAGSVVVGAFVNHWLQLRRDEIQRQEEKKSKLGIQRGISEEFKRIRSRRPYPGYNCPNFVPGLKRTPELQEKITVVLDLVDIDERLRESSQRIANIVVSMYNDLYPLKGGRPNEDSDDSKDTSEPSSEEQQ